MKKRFIALICVCLLCFTAIAPSAQALSQPTIAGTSGILCNMTTGETYYEKYADNARVPASLTKLMTVFLVYEALARGDISIDSPVSISRHAQAVALDPDGSNVPLYTSCTYTVGELLEVTLGVSANGAACALGEKLYGSESACVSAMNARAREIGWDFTFYDSYGISSKNRITARSAASLATVLITRYPQILELTSKTSISFWGERYSAGCLLLPGKSYGYSGADGLKTGTTSAAGKCLIATAYRNGTRLIAVTLGASTISGRYTDATKMLDYGFARAGSNASLIRSPQTFYLNNNYNSNVGAYFTGGSNYIRLRDIARLLNGTPSQFSIGWNGETKTIAIQTGAAYTDDGSSAATANTVLGSRSAATITVNGNPVSLGGYSIAGNNYFTLRELGNVLNFGVDYNSATKCVYLASR